MDERAPTVCYQEAVQDRDIVQPQPGDQSEQVPWALVSDVKVPEQPMLDTLKVPSSLSMLPEQLPEPQVAEPELEQPPLEQLP